jgi:hypothetical protein
MKYLLLLFAILNLSGCGSKDPVLREKYPLHPNGIIKGALPANIQNQLEGFLEKENIPKDEILFITISTEKQGTILLASEKAEVRELAFPIDTKRIKNITPISIIDFEGSHCQAVVEGGSGSTVCSRRH